MNKFALLIATPGLLILADWAAHEHEAGYNTALARGLFFTFIFTALAVFIKGQYQTWQRDRLAEAKRAEAIRVMLQASIDRNLNKKGDKN